MKTTRTDQPPPGHGTLHSYRNKKCRCDWCREANSEYQRELKARYRETGGRGEHGTTYRYDTGCRCNLCRLAHNKKSAAWKRQRRRDGYANG
jgi:hypothetical protein